MCLSKRKIIAQRKTSPDVINAVHFTVQEAFPIKAFVLGIILPDSTNERHPNFATVYYNTPEDGQLQRSRHTVVWIDDSSSLAQDWRHKANLPDWYSAYLDIFISVLMKFKSMWAGHFGRISVAIYCLEYSDEKTQAAHSAPSRAGPKNKSLRKPRLKRCCSERS